MHYWNRKAEIKIDLTKQQFSDKLHFKNVKRWNREDLLATGNVAILCLLFCMLSLLCFLAVQRDDRVDIVDNEMLGIEIVENALVWCAVLIGSLLGKNTEIFT